jgi:hypothetical protein
MDTVMFSPRIHILLIEDICTIQVYYDIHALARTITHELYVKHHKSLMPLSGYPSCFEYAWRQFEFIVQLTQALAN